MRNLAQIKGIFSLLITSILVFSSCKKDNGYTIPVTYSFDNVNYNGQTYRLSMLEELISYAETSNLIGAAQLNAQKLKDMYANVNNQFTDTTLNSCGKNLKDKTVSTEQNLIESLLDSLATSSAFCSNNSPVQGSAGIMQTNDGANLYLVNSNGVQLSEIIEKAIMGATFYYQATAVYFGDGQMNVDNSTVVPGEGTAMEHHWDEAFGYFGVPTDFPTNISGIIFWGKYCNARETHLGLNSTIMNAFKAGRAAISNKDIGERNVQITLIRRKWELIAAATAVSYLNNAISNFSTDTAIKHHALSEAYGFIYGLKWGGDATISASSVDVILVAIGGSNNPLQANFYNSSLSSLQNAKDAIIAAFPGLSAVKDSL